MNEIVEFVEEVAGIYFRSVLLPDAGTFIPQHMHDYDHATYVASGSVRLFVNNQEKAIYKAGSAVLIQANKQHSFLSLEPNTRLACIHDAESADSIKVKGL